MSGRVQIQQPDAATARQDSAYWQWHVDHAVAAAVSEPGRLTPAVQGAVDPAAGANARDRHHGESAACQGQSDVEACLGLCHHQ